MSICEKLKVVRTGAQNGAYNMGLDEALFERAIETGEAWLRFYRWTEPTLSFGRFQRPRAQVDLELATGLGLAFVRRPTGGKALVHDDELTYSLVLPPGHPVTRLSVSDSHSLLARSLARAVDSLGIRAVVARPRACAPSRAARPCFAEHLAESVLVGGRKLAGSAQLRHSGALLQHGSIVRSFDFDLHRKLFPSGGDVLGDHVVGWSELADFTAEDLEREMIKTMSDCLFQGRRVDSELPEVSTRRASVLAANKYSRLDWAEGGSAVA